MEQPRSDCSLLGTPKVRRKTRALQVGSVKVGGDAPISVQSMTNTLTADAQATLTQIREIAEAGADLVRVSVPDEAAAEAFKTITRNSPLPVIADIHFDHHLGLLALKHGAACLRINPGNIGSSAKIDELIDCARHHGAPIRIGINAGSLEKHLLEKYGEPSAEAMLESLKFHMNLLESRKFFDFKVSLKSSFVPMMLEAYRKAAGLTDAPFHLGVTEAGTLLAGTVKSTLGIGLLLLEGLGDTLRISLAADVKEEVKVGRLLLKTLGLKQGGVTLIACPSCSRQQFQVIETANALESLLENEKGEFTLSLIGCIVNGPGEAKTAHLGLTGGTPNHLLYLNGKVLKKLPSDLSPQSLARAIYDAFLEHQSRLIARS